MINPMIVMTTSISTKVKPACPRRAARPLLDSAHGFMASCLLHIAQSANLACPSASRRDAKNLRRCGHSCSALFDGIVQHGCHAGADGSAINKGRVGLRAYQRPDFVGEFEQFENPGTPAITRVAAAFTTDRAIYRLACRKSEKPIARIRDQILLGQQMLAFAGSAKHTHQPLSNHGPQR